eukprot:snap_masked-scaffold_13-processed-gene-5.25-mRNA-1 protein AED:1.00 eAED:1.00 QI:0/-1/0/0/-1/1/1/0/298
MFIIRISHNSRPQQLDKAIEDAVRFESFLKIRFSSPRASTQDPNNARITNYLIKLISQKKNSVSKVKVQWAAMKESQLLSNRHHLLPLLKTVYEQSIFKEKFSVSVEHLHFFLENEKASSFKKIPKFITGNELNLSYFSLITPKSAFLQSKLITFQDFHTLHLVIDIQEKFQLKLFHDILIDEDKNILPSLKNLKVSVLNIIPSRLQFLLHLMCKSTFSAEKFCLYPSPITFNELKMKFPKRRLKDLLNICYTGKYNLRTINFEFWEYLITREQKRYFAQMVHNLPTKITLSSAYILT